MRVLSGLLFLLASANLALSQRSTICSNSGVCASLATNSNNVYVQVSAPNSNGWAAVGIGSQMSGALMFIIYPDGSGGVTVSTRLGSGNFEPDYDDSFKIETLDGTGITNGRMVANIKCSNCESWSGGSLGSNWIYARNSRQSVSSRSTSASLSQHNDWGVLRGMNLASAQTTSEAPFQNFIGGVTSNNAGTDTGDSANGGTTDETTNGGNNGVVGGSQGGSSSTVPGFKVLLAHAICMIIAFVIIFPLGGFIIRIPANIGPQRVRIHYALQGLAFILALVGFGLIIWYCDYRDSHFKRTHQKLGVVPIALLLVQFVLGIVHHSLFKSRGVAAPKFTRYAHRWLGRITIILGIATTASGIFLADELGKWEVEGKKIRPLMIAFWVLVGVFVALWVTAAVLDSVKEYKSKRKVSDSASSREPDADGEMRESSRDYTKGTRRTQDQQRYA